MDTSFRTIYVENFPLNSTEKVLQKIFVNFGHIRQIDLPTFDSGHPICKGLARPKSKGYAFVEFTKKESADKACKFFNELVYIDLINKLDTDMQRTTNSSTFDDPQLVEKITSNLEFKKLLLLRVMPKKKYSELSKVYNEQRLCSLINAARLLVIA